jgi:adenylate kinase
VYNLTSAHSRIEGVCDVCGGPVVQRTDEDETTVRHRLEVYHESTAPLLKFYSGRGLLREIDARGSEDEVTARVKSAISDLAGD